MKRRLFEKLGNSKGENRTVKFSWRQVIVSLECLKWQVLRAFLYWRWWAGGRMGWWSLPAAPLLARPQLASLDKGEDERVTNNVVIGTKRRVRAIAQVGRRQKTREFVALECSESMSLYWAYTNTPAVEVRCFLSLSGARPSACSRSSLKTCLMISFTCLLETTVRLHLCQLRPFLVMVLLFSCICLGFSDRFVFRSVGIASSNTYRGIKGQKTDVLPISRQPSPPPLTYVLPAASGFPFFCTFTE